MNSIIYHLQPHHNNNNSTVHTHCRPETEITDTLHPFPLGTWPTRCGEGRIMSPDGKGCMDRNECLDLPCLNGATCINMDPKERYQCRCLDGFWGANCELVQEGQTLKLSMGALAAILVCLLIILSMGVFWSIQRRRKKKKPPGP